MIDYDSVLLGTKLLVMFVVVISILFGVIFPLIKNITKQHGERLGYEKPISQIQSHLVVEEIEIPSIQSGTFPNNHRIIQIAKEHNETTKLIVKSWLSESKRDNFE